MTAEIVTAGIDVVKLSLDVSVSDGSVKHFQNNTQAITSLIQCLRKQSVTRVVCEPTGGYEQCLVHRLQATNIAVHIAHPNKVRAFAGACGQQAKTDALDARMLCRFGVAFEVSASPKRDHASLVLQGFLRRRRQLIDQRVQEKNRLEKGLEGSVKHSCERHIVWLSKEIVRVSAEYMKVVKKNPVLAERAALYQSVCGVGELTAATLIAYLPELGEYNGKSLTALVGLAPWSHDSGKQRGYRAIRGGRSVVRCALYLPALSAIRHDGEMKRFYDRLRKRGKSGKVALVAVMRKLLLLLNAIARRGTPWVERDTSTT